MLRDLYARWMYSWETALTTRDSNRIVRPVEWGFEWLDNFVRKQGLAETLYGPGLKRPGDGPEDRQAAEEAMIALNREIIHRSEDYFGYTTPCDFRLESRHPQLFPTNVRPETLAHEAKVRRRAAGGKTARAEFLRFTSAERTPHPENDQVNARWFPASRPAGQPKQAIVVLPQWNADAFSHNALCRIFNRFGVSALRLSKPYHDIRRPAEIERSDYACSSNIGRTLSACRQAVVDIRSCLDWLEQQGYEHFGILATSLGSCYGFMAAAHDPRLKVCAFNHASTSFGDVVWTGQSTRHIRAACEQVMTRETLNKMWAGVSPIHYMDRFAAFPKKVLVVHAEYDLTFLKEFSLEVLANFRTHKVDFVSKVLPCGHYTTGEAPYKFIDGWYLGSFVYKAFRDLAKNSGSMPALRSAAEESELAAR